MGEACGMCGGKEINVQVVGWEITLLNHFNCTN